MPNTFSEDTMVVIPMAVFTVDMEDITCSASAPLMLNPKPRLIPKSFSEDTTATPMVLTEPWDTLMSGARSKSNQKLSQQQTFQAPHFQSQIAIHNMFNNWKT
jgi:hypothetical protein